jgi:hypothetical protein
MTNIDRLQYIIEKNLVADLSTHQTVLGLIAQIRAELSKPKPDVPKT